MKGLTLTKKQRALQEEVSGLLNWLQVIPDLSKGDSALRTSRLTWAKRELIITAILREYLLMDEHLSNEMCNEFFCGGHMLNCGRPSDFPRSTTISSSAYI